LMSCVFSCGNMPLTKDSSARNRRLSDSTLPYTRCFRGSFDSHSTSCLLQFSHASLLFNRMHRVRRSLHRSQLTSARFLEMVSVLICCCFWLIVGGAIWDVYRHVKISGSFYPPQDVEKSHVPKDRRYVGVVSVGGSPTH
jgi:hypothetical protein